MDNLIKRIVLTGGPGGGKTLCLDADKTQKDYGWLRNRVKENGWFLLTIQEIATELSNSGLELSSLSLEVQKQIMLAQMEREDRYFKLAQAIGNPKTVILQDRGVLCSRAYMSERSFNQTLKELSFKMMELRDQRYDAVFHLITTAIGAEDHYNHDNPARYENIQLARIRDLKIRNVWVGHRHFRVFDNSTDFEGKKERFAKEFFRVLGVPDLLEIERKFLVQGPVFFPQDLHVVEIEIEQVYLKSGERIRRSGQDGYFLYYKTRKKGISPGIKRETEERINKETYYTLRTMERNPEKDIIKKSRFCFIWDCQHFELDIFLEPERISGLTVLELELSDINDPVILPPFIKKYFDVTEDERYSNPKLALKFSPIRKDTQ